MTPFATKPMANVHAETGIAYGYISANALDPEVVERLFNGGQARNFTMERVQQEITDEVHAEAAERGFDHGSPDWEDFVGREIDRLDDAGNSCSFDEPHIEGEYEGVSYATSYLGGALNFWIFESPFQTHSARRASPCVPGAAILDELDGHESGYDVPGEWRAEWMELRVDSNGMIEYAYGDRNGSWSCRFSLLAEVGAPYQARAERELELLIERKGGAIEHGVELDDAPYAADFWREFEK